MSYDSWKTTNPEDQFLGPEPTFLPFPQSRPCKWDKMSGECLKCGNGPDEGCAFEHEHPLVGAANEIIAEQNRVLASVHAALMEGKVQEALAWIRGQQ